MDRDGTFGWCILGTGRIAATFAECLQSLPGARLAAVGSRTAEKSAAFCGKYGGKPYGSYLEAVRDPETDVVYVATPHQVHERDVILAAEAGKAVLCEKPFAVNAGQTRRMIAAARKNGVFLMEGLWSRFFPAWQYVKDLVRREEYGPVLAINSTTCWGKKDLPSEHRLLDPNLTGGSLLDAGIYSLAAVSFLMGDRPLRRVTGSMQIGATGVDETASVRLDYEGNVTASVTSAIYGWSFYTEILCRDATIVVPRHRNPDTVHIRRRIQGILAVEGEEETLRFPFEGEGFRFEAEAVQDCLRRGLTECPEAPLTETRLLSEICTKVRRDAGFLYPFEDPADLAAEEENG